MMSYCGRETNCPYRTNTDRCGYTGYGCIQEVLAEKEMVKPSLDQIKQMAKELGYKLVPNNNWIKKTRCTCGRKRLEARYGLKGIFWVCPKCGKQGPPAPSERKAAIAWNEMIEKER